MVESQDREGIGAADLLVRSTDILDEMYDGVYLVDRQRRIRFWNRGAERLSGYASADVLGTACSDNLLMHVNSAGESLCLTGCPLAATMDDGVPREAEAYLHHRDGHRVPVLVRTSPIRDARGVIIGGVEVFDDNSARTSMRQEIESLRSLALVDALTGVGNRRYVDITLASRHDELERYGWAFGVLLFDIDHFKAFNDRFGHAVGDRVLRMVAQTMSASVRSFDVVGRWGGEEFVVILEKISLDQLSERANSLRRLVAASNFTEGAVSLSVTVSAGGTLARVGEPVAETLRRADGLLYESKAAGRNRCSLA